MPRRCPPLARSEPASCRTGRYALLLLVGLAVVPHGAGARPATPLRVAAALTLSGPAANIGEEVLEGIEMGVEEAGPQAPPIDLAIIDDQGSVDGARDAARRIAEGDALAVIGPSLSTVALAVHPVYAEAGLAVVAPTSQPMRRPASFA